MSARSLLDTVHSGPVHTQAVDVVGEAGAAVLDALALSRIFEPFATGKQIAYGTGLTLAAVLGAVKQNAGDIRVRSGPESMTTFEITFPEHLDIDGEPPVERASLAQGGHETIPLVEDDPGVRQLSSQILLDYGYQLLEAEDASEALRLFSTV